MVAGRTVFCKAYMENALYISVLHQFKSDKYIHARYLNDELHKKENTLDQSVISCIVGDMIPW